MKQPRYSINRCIFHIIWFTGNCPHPIRKYFSYRLSLFSSHLNSKLGCECDYLTVIKLSGLKVIYRNPKNIHLNLYTIQLM